MNLPICPIATAQNVQAISPTIADSGRAVPTKPRPIAIENAVAAAGAM